jgi:hypothetical protein
MSEILLRWLNDKMANSGSGSDSVEYWWRARQKRMLGVRVVIDGFLVTELSLGEILLARRAGAGAGAHLHHAGADHTHSTAVTSRAVG